MLRNSVVAGFALAATLVAAPAGGAASTNVADTAVPTHVVSFDDVTAPCNASQQLALKHLDGVTFKGLGGVLPGGCWDPGLGDDSNFLAFGDQGAGPTSPVERHRVWLSGGMHTVTFGIPVKTIILASANVRWPVHLLAVDNIVY